MKKYDHTKYAQNEQEMLALFRKLDWRDQVILIGRMETMAEQAESAKIIRFPIETGEVHE